jgi:hypothetical protein
MKRLINTQAGYTLKGEYIYYEGEPHLVYIICKKIRVFGITFKKNMYHCLDMYHVNTKIKKLNISLT